MPHAPDTRTGMFAPAGLLSWYTAQQHCLGNYQKGVQVYDAALERKRACLQFEFPSSTGGQTSYWQ